MIITTLTGPEIHPLFISMTGSEPPPDTVLEIGEDDESVFVGVSNPLIMIAIHSLDGGGLRYHRALHASGYYTTITLDAGGSGHVSLIRKNPRTGEILDMNKVALLEVGVRQLKALSQQALAFASPCVTKARKGVKPAKTII